MHCFYTDFDKSDKQIALPDSELKHLKVIRLKDNENFAVSNGKGLFARCSLDGDLIKIKEIFENYNENKIKVNLFCAIIQDRGRIEWLVEKATEMGVNKLVFFPSEFSQKIKLNLERLNKKAIASLKQSNRSILPEIKILNSINEISDFGIENIIIADQFGNDINFDNLSEINLFVGPEAGFSNKDIEYFDTNYKIKKIKLSNSILRTETACIAILARTNGN